MKLTNITEAFHQGSREYMEDRVLVKSISDTLHLMVVADGHGGEEASDFVIQSLYQWDLKKEMTILASKSKSQQEQCEYWVNLLHQKFQSMDVKFRSHYPNRQGIEKQESPGTTICGMLIDCAIKSVIVFNIGDSQCVMTGSNYEFISTPHTVKSLRERRKILADHPNAKFTDLKTDPRLYGLNMTRAFGNFNIRGLDKALNREIDYTVLQFENKVFPIDIVIATDGLFDEVSARKIAKIQHEKGTRLNALQLLRMAQEIDSKGDNIGIICATIKR